MKKSIGWIVAGFACFSLVSAFANEEVAEQQVTHFETSVVAELPSDANCDVTVSCEITSHEAVDTNSDAVQVQSEVAATEVPASLTE